MRLNFEKFLNENGLKVGDKVKLENGDICEICERTNDGFILINEDKERIDYSITILGLHNFEKVESNKKIGDLKCVDTYCEKCPLHCIQCEDYYGGTIRERFEISLKKHPELEQMRPYFEAELDKDVEEE